MNQEILDNLLWIVPSIIFIAYLIWMVWYYIRYRKKLRTGNLYDEKDEKNWIRTTGWFTGQSKQEAGYHTKSGISYDVRTSYEVLYYVDGEARKGWYQIYPEPDVDMITEKLGVTVRYAKKKPWDFKIEKIHFPESCVKDEENTEEEKTAFYEELVRENTGEKKMNAEKIFLAYASAYDCKNGMIQLKIVHTMEVAKVMDRLTEKLKLSSEMCELAHICAVFHDIGRFEQVKKYNTFLDHLSEDHADLGCKVLEENEILAGLPEKQQKMILTAIHNHNKYAIEDGLDEDTLLLCKLIRDADKSDIFRVFACEDMVDTMGETIEQVEQETITDSVYNCIFEHKCVDKTIRRTGLDKWVGFLAFFFDMYFPESLEMLQDKRYYRQPFDQAKFADLETQKRVEKILEEVENYIEEQIRIAEK